MRILVIAAHPDDEVLGCGATVARLTSEGHSVFLAILGEGITSRFARKEDADDGMIRHLQESSHKVANLLNAEGLRMFNLPDNRFDTVPLLDIVKIVEGVIRDTRPDRIYTHNSSDLNQDHCLVNRATMIATRPQGTEVPREILAFEIPSSTEWTFQTLQPVFQPNVFVDVTKTMDIKVAAMQIYDSEKRSSPHPRSPESLRAIASRWGSVSGVKAAEAFQLIRSIE